MKYNNDNVNGAHINNFNPERIVNNWYLKKKGIKHNEMALSNAQSEHRFYLYYFNRYLFLLFTGLFFLAPNIS